MSGRANATVPKYQTLCGNVFYFDNNTFGIACTLCGHECREPEDFFVHILADHVSEENEFDGNINVKEEKLDDDLEDDEDGETVYLEEDYDLDCDYSSDDGISDLKQEQDNHPVRSTEKEKSAQYLRIFEELEPLLVYISKCHWLWSAGTDKNKIKNSTLRFLRHKYYLVNRSTITTRDLDYRIRLLRGMRRECSLADEYIKRLEFFDDIPKDILECPDDLCDFQSNNEDQFCEHIFEFHFVPDEKIYECENCSLKTKTYKKFLKHLKACGVSSDSSASRKLKGKSKFLASQEIISLQCLICGKEHGEDIEAFNNHMRQHNKIVKTKFSSLKTLYKCNTDSTTSLKRSLAKPEDDLECDICGRTLHFRNVEDFNKHMRLHNKIQLFKCRDCKKVSRSHICDECQLTKT